MRAVLALALVAAVVPAVAVEYRVYDLGPPGPFHHSEAFAINDAGMVTLKQTTYADIPYVWTPQDGFARMGPLINWEAGAWPHAINNAGMAAGRLRHYNKRTLPFRWTRIGGFQWLPILPGKQTGESMAINELGEVAGTCRRFGTPDRAFFWSPADGLVDIGALWADGESMVFGMNDSGVVVGLADFLVNNVRRPFAFRWSRALGIEALPLPQGTIESWGQCVNNQGVIVGEAYDQNTNVYAFRLVPGDIPRLLHPDFNRVTDINELGVILGSGRRGACTFDDVNGLTFINERLDAQSQGWELSSARSINNQGWIVGRGQFGGKTRACLAVPH